MIISIDGIDGAGKGTQAKKIQEYLIGINIPAKIVSFPIYSSFFGKMISEYLNGLYGSLYSINPKLASLLYAQDRHLFFQNEVVDSNEVLILDRYVYSNIAHHASKIPEQERQKFIDWIINLEFYINKIPKPDISFILDVEIENSISNVAKKKKRDYTELIHDLHESNFDYLLETRNVFLSLEDYKNTYLIRCDIKGLLRNQNEISKEILSIISDSLITNKVEL